MTSTTPRTAGLHPMRPRDPSEPHRTASTLELFFDLTFVVAVSIAAQELLTAEEGGSPARLVLFLPAFFAIWWAWVNFTWFASAFDTDDWLYRVITVVQMGGVLVLSAGIEAAAREADFRVMVVGYVIMRLAMVAQWLRAARNRRYRVVALRYAGGIAVLQALWVLYQLTPPALAVPAFAVLAVGELLVPAFAERAQGTPFHLHHVGERYGLFTLIVLGEGLLATTNTLIEAQRETEHTVELVVLGATGLVLLAGMWWIYFSRETHAGMTSVRSTFAFGYAHYVVFGAAAALAPGLELAVHEESSIAVRAAATLPVGLFVLSVWAVVLRASLGRLAQGAVPLLGVLIAASALVPGGVQLAALLVVATVVVLEVDGRRASGGRSRAGT